MKTIIDNVWGAIGVVLLLILAMLLTTIIIEYTRYLWIRHKTNKALKRIFKDATPLDRHFMINQAVSDEELQKELDEIGKDFEKNE